VQQPERQRQQAWQHRQGRQRPEQQRQRRERPEQQRQQREQPERGREQQREREPVQEQLLLFYHKQTGKQPTGRRAGESVSYSIVPYSKL